MASPQPQKEVTGNFRGGWKAVIVPSQVKRSCKRILHYIYKTGTRDCA